MDVSVIIVNWNTKELLSNCINSIQEKTAGVSYEIIIVDNNSADGSAEMIKMEFPHCKLVASNKNNGFSRGNNLGIHEAIGRYIFFLNPDTILVTNALNGMFKLMESNQSVGAVGCKLLNRDGSIQFICARTFPTLFNQFSYYMMFNRLFPKSKRFTNVELGYWDHKESMEIDCLSGACIFAKKSIIDKIEGFDDSFFMYAEDVDLCYRIKQEGWKLYYLASEEIYHLGGASSKKQSHRYFSAIAMRESNYLLFNKHYGKTSSQIYKVIIFVGSLFRLIIIVASIFDLRNGWMKMSDKKTALLKYANLASWSIGLRKVVKPHIDV